MAVGVKMVILQVSLMLCTLRGLSKLSYSVVVTVLTWMKNVKLISLISKCVIIKCSCFSRLPFHKTRTLLSQKLSLFGALST